MFDVWIGGINAMVVLAALLLVLLPLQLFLCFRVKSVAIRLLPAVIFGVLTVLFGILSQSAEGWDGLGYAVLAIYTAILLLACAVCWLVWGIVRASKKKQHGLNTDKSLHG